MRYRPEYDKKLIGRNLRRCRQAKNLSVEQVREYLCIGSIQAIYKWEEGKSYPQTDTMFALMELYEIGLQELIYKETEEVSKEAETLYEIDTRFVKNGTCTEQEKEGKMRRLLWYNVDRHYTRPNGHELSVIAKQLW